MRAFLVPLFLCSTVQAEQPFAHPMRVTLDPETSRAVFAAMQGTPEVIAADPDGSVSEETLSIEGMFCRHSHSIEAGRARDRYRCEMSGAGNGEPGVLVEPTAQLVYYRLKIDTTEETDPAKPGEASRVKRLGRLTCKLTALTQRQQLVAIPEFLCRYDVPPRQSRD